MGRTRGAPVRWSTLAVSVATVVGAVVTAAAVPARHPAAAQTTGGDDVVARHPAAAQTTGGDDVVAMAAAPDGQGYAIVEADGTVHTYGSVSDHGGTDEIALSAPVVGVALTPTGNGYWLFAADGGVFTYGDARFTGSAGDLPLVAPIVGGAPTPTGNGYWLAAADGGVFTYGDARFTGSAAGLPLTQPIIGIDATASGDGYRLFAADGGEFDYGDARFIDSAAGRGIVFSAFAVRPDDDGHWFVTADGRIQQSGLAPRLGAPDPGPPTAPVPAPPVGALDVGLVRVGEFTEPIATRPRPGDRPDVVYVAERRGHIVRLDPSTGVRSTVIDIDALTTTTSERGLLSFDFSPDGDTLYLVHTDSDGDVDVAEYAMSGNVAVAATRRLLLVIDQPFGNHNGGDLHVGDDGMLWISSGDGGSGGDPQNNAQNTSNLLGALLRIDPAPGPAGAYSIPPDNPFAGRPGFRGEIWAYGLRNPWRFSIDEPTGDLWIGDVGQGRFEEIDWEPPGNGGRNYGWRRFEGSSLFSGGTDAPGAVGPIHVYDHDEGCSVTGGVVYRGDAVAGLAGTYLFADHCSGTIWGLRHDRGTDVQVAPLGVSASRIVDFSTDGTGEVLITSLGGTVFRLGPG